MRGAALGVGRPGLTRDEVTPVSWKNSSAMAGEATAILKGTPNLAAAKKLADFAATKEANMLYNESYSVLAYPGIAKPIANIE